MFRSEKIRMIVYALPALGWMSIIFYLSSLTASQMPSAHGIPDYILHAAIYFVLAFFLFVFFQRVHQRGLAVTFVLTMIVGLLYALSDEWHQSYVPTRSCSGWDILADMVGMVLCFPLLIALQCAGSKGRWLYGLMAARPKSLCLRCAFPCKLESRQ